ncbi:hypothetical protein [Candidatus Uabimicrobium sp. HlEnr_7]|uniref:hypothetical protein n=1 Tax=Candidatus Uabimicrobium helgolandensis TaxID=3095367 RepID=UPI003555E25C
MSKFWKSRKFFTAWFGLGVPPFLLGTIYLSFLLSTIYGIITTVVVSLWTYDTFNTTCRRCPFYNTTKCGIPGMVVPLLFSKKSPYDISIIRVKLHYYFDLAMIVYVNFIYIHFPYLYPFVFIGSVIGYIIVFHSKRFHGLLFRLKAKPKI